MDFTHAMSPRPSETGHNQRWLDVAMIYLRVRQISLTSSSPNGRAPHKTKATPSLQEHLSLNLHLADVLSRVKHTQLNVKGKTRSQMLS